jgi:hypothetical protein
MLTVNDVRRSVQVFFACNCEDNRDALRRTWFCPVHGQQEPNYDAMDRAEKKVRSQCAYPCVCAYRDEDACLFQGQEGACPLVKKWKSGGLV